MPTVFIIYGFRFFFFSNEGTEPIHIHIEKAEKHAKFWMNPVCLAKNYKFTSAELKKLWISLKIIKTKSRRNGMTTSINEPRAEKVKVTADTLIVYLVDGRKLEVPLAWFPRLCKATAVQRKLYRLIGEGIGIHWSKIDEDISVEGLLGSASPLTFQKRKFAA